jgi:hypothetical protein
VVVHDVFKNWRIFSVVNKVKINLLISSNIDSNITFDEIKKTFMLKLKVLSPEPFFSLLIINSLEEQNVTRTSAN